MLASYAKTMQSRDKLTVRGLQITGMPKSRSMQLARDCSVSAVTGSLAV